MGTARKDNGIFLRPIKDGYQRKWEGHHATNPCSVRFKSDPRVFLGYRAGGDDDIYFVHQYKVWGSHLGLAVLDEFGEKIVNRLPLPVMRIEHDVKLPQSTDEYYNEYSKGPDTQKITILHDFRFFEYRNDLYVVYHEGPVDGCFDCVVKMPVDLFLKKIEQSIQLSRRPTEEIIDEWRALWWAAGVWEPCGVGGTNRIFPSTINKGDIVYYELNDGTLQMGHRPLANGCAVFKTGEKFYADATADGLTEYGVFESNTRPGYTDNSHIGNNGAPVRAKIGDTDVFVEIIHGCWSNLISTKCETGDIMYYAYLRIKDCETGELLYYSEDPVIDYGKEWDKEAIFGEWVAMNAALQGVMFAGGQIDRVAGKNGVDDEFITYVGLGDTSIGLARFTLREVLPARVIEDIKTRGKILAAPVSANANTEYTLKEKPCGWQWSLRNNSKKRAIEVVRILANSGETAIREINSRPGYFDAHGLSFNPADVFIDNALEAIVVIYQGFRCEEKTIRSGYGVLILSLHNPDQVLYRSMMPVFVSVSGAPAEFPAKCFAELVPEKTIREIRNLNELRTRGMPYSYQMELWLKEKSACDERKK